MASASGVPKVTKSQPRSRQMKIHVKRIFKIADWDEKSFPKLAGGGKLMRGTITQSFILFLLIMGSIDFCANRSEAHRSRPVARTERLAF
jgi:hypothetical protein